MRALERTNYTRGDLAKKINGALKPRRGGSGERRGHNSNGHNTRENIFTIGLATAKWIREQIRRALKRT